MMHMGYVDEVLFGREVATRLPEIASNWVREFELRRQEGKPYSRAAQK